VRELEQVRRRGYAMAVDELEIGLSAVAAPIRNNHGEVVASMSVSGPTFRMGARHLLQMAEAVTEAADEVSVRLGCVAPVPSADGSSGEGLDGHTRT
jgi:DNA-binding IclR family transcriptional regulator